MLSYTVITVQTHVAIVQFCINKYTTYALQMLLKQLLPIDIFFYKFQSLQNCSVLFIITQQLMHLRTNKCFGRQRENETSTGHIGTA